MDLYHEIRQHFYLPDCYTDWQHYRESLTNYLLQETKQHHLPLSFHADMSFSELQPSLLIVGAGACNDLDLAMLLPEFSSITLLDYDSIALNTALSTYGLTGNPKIRLCVESLTGLTDTDYAHFCSKLSQYIRRNSANNQPITNTGFDDYCCATFKELLESSNQNQSSFGNTSYDFVWCMGVHSQLQAMPAYIYRVFDTNLSNGCPSYCSFEQEPEFFKLLKAENDWLIPQLHNQLLQCTKQKLYIGVEACRVNEYNEPLTSLSPIEGAAQAIQDLTHRVLSMTSTHFFWPFYPQGQQYYDMILYQIAKQ